MSFNTPIAFIIFNRPEYTKKVFNEIRKIKPKKLFLIADGPRENNLEDIKLCQKTRGIVSKIDWKCKVHKNFSEENIGCGIRPYTGIDWVFQHVDRAIILEDDCLPSKSFFRFCEELLERYKDNEKVMMISGSNFQPKSKTKYSYHFSKHPVTWGWATWRRAWQNYDFKIKDWPRFKKSKLFKKICPRKIEREYWTKQFYRVYGGKRDIWDYQWIHACWIKRGITIHPKVNLISNIGHGPKATHTFWKKNPIANFPRQDMKTINHPPKIILSKKYDNEIFHIIAPNTKKVKNNFFKKLRNYYKSFKNNSPPKNTQNKKEAWLEITTNIGCINQCNYCPQKTIMNAYSKKSPISNMSLEMFKKYLTKVPKNVIIHFSGFSEPFLNPNCSKLILYAHKKGYVLEIATTLIGMKESDINLIEKIPFKKFLIHLPDNKSQTRIKVNKPYLIILEKIIKSKIKNKQFMILRGPKFNKVHSKIKKIIEKYSLSLIGWHMYSRAGNTKEALDLRNIYQYNNLNIKCPHISHPVLLPNGEVALCCMDYGLKHITGNLNTDNYSDLFKSKEFLRALRGMKDPSSDVLCKNCEFNYIPDGNKFFIDLRKKH